LALPAVLVLSGCVATPQSGITNSSSPSELIPAPASGVPTTSAPLETAQTSNKAPVYWIGRGNDNAFLYREFRDVPDQDNPVTRALRVMMSQKPLDPDFFHALAKSEEAGDVDFRQERHHGGCLR
jgi:hypothetical protein